MFVNFAAGWGTLALINAAIAQLQRRGTLLWLLISLILGPIATIILIVTYTSPKALADELKDFLKK